MTDEKFCQFFREDFRNPDSVSHLQLEFEKAFWLMKCIEEVPGLKAAGMEMLGQIMREENAMETLREHFHLDIFDLYQWNGEHMYKTPWLISEIEEGSQQLAYYKDILKQKDEYIGQSDWRIAANSNTTYSNAVPAPVSPRRCFAPVIAKSYLIFRRVFSCQCP